MKGHPDEPKCGFSRKVVEALKTAGVKFGSFNILADNDVREGLKVYSSWPSYPQVYVDGELVGGCDIILELAEAGELKEACSSKESKVQNAINDRIKSMLAAQDVILFMKGTRTEPRCGFSAKVVQALDAIGVEYATFDILQDEPIRQGLKEYSQWPTYPQCFYKSELIGGCDIILEMAAEGSLAAELGMK
jgi:Grx4 family monothiol glutaredoxin